MAHVRRLWAVREGSGSASSTGAPAAAGSGAAPSSAGIDENADGDAREGLPVTFPQTGDRLISGADPGDDEDGTAVVGPEGYAPRNLHDPVYTTKLRPEKLDFWRMS